MPDSAQEKTEAPTPRRRSEARNQGQVAKSQDLAAAITLLGGLILLNVSGEKILRRLVEITQTCLGAGAEMTDGSLMAPTIMGILKSAAELVLPLMILVTVLALGAAYFQVGNLLTFKPMTPSLNKLNPLSGLKRMFSPRSFMQLVMGLAKMSLLCLVAYITIKEKLNALIFASALHDLGVVGLSAHLAYTLGLRLAAVLLLLALLDYAYQRYRTEKDMMMTKEEVKEEMKRMDGDPKVKQRRRQVQMQMSIQRIRGAVPQADVVVTNPTELAVALKYDSETMTAPKVVAKGAGFMAQRIREVAVQHGVPIVERKPLARALYKTVEVGQEIPAQFYQTVAEILAYVYELAGKRKGRSRSRTPEPALN